MVFRVEYRKEGIKGEKPDEYYTNRYCTFCDNYKQGCECYPLKKIKVGELVENA